MSEHWTGQTLSKVQIQQLIGRGGMADVYLGLHTTLNVPRAVKVLHGHLSSDPDLMRRFRDEAKSVAALRHPNIVQVYDFDLLDGRPYIVMELLRGMSLAAYLKGLHQLGTSLPLDIVARILDSLSAALDYAHDQGIVHRDMKPANVLLRQGSTTPLSPSLPLPPDAEPILTDFGIARISGATTQTLTGTILGTPAYMSPEQVRGEAVDARSDNYSLGIILYEMLAGTLPFDPEVDTTASVLYKQANVPPPPLANTSPRIQAVVDRALSKDKANRFQKAGDLAVAFRQTLGAGATTVVRPRKPAGPAPPPAPRRRSLWLGLIGFAAAALVIGAGAIFAINSVLSPFFDSPAPTAIGPTAEAGPTVSTTEPSGQTSVAPTQAPVAAVAGGSVFQDASLQAILRGIPEPGANQAYGVWLRGEDASLLIAETAFSAGNLTIAFVDPEGRNLLALYGEMLISLEPDPDPSPAIPGEIFYQARPDATLLLEIRRLDELTRGSSLSASVVQGLRAQAQTHDSHLGFALTAGENDNLASVKQHSEHTINVLVGTESVDFADYDGNSRPENPGDGYGALTYLQVALALVRSEVENPDTAPASLARLRSLADEIEAAIVLAEDSLRLAKQITSVDSPQEAQPLLARWEPMRLSESVGRIALQLETNGFRLWVPVTAIP